MRLGPFLLILLSFVLVGCGSQQGYECRATPELCSLYIEQAENREMMLQLSTIVGECKKLGLTEYEMWLGSKKDWGQCILSENELNVRGQHNEALWNRINQK